MAQYSKARKLMSEAEALRRQGKTDEAVFMESQARQLRQLEKINLDREKEQKRMSLIEQATNNLTWEIQDGAGNHIIGFYEPGAPLFEITRGTALYNLKILDPDTKARFNRNITTSVQMNRLKNKADKICKDHYIPFC